MSPPSPTVVRIPSARKASTGSASGSSSASSNKRTQSSQSQQPTKKKSMTIKDSDATFEAPTNRKRARERDFESNTSPSSEPRRSKRRLHPKTYFGFDEVLSAFASINYFLKESNSGKKRKGKDSGSEFSGLKYM